MIRRVFFAFIIAALSHLLANLARADGLIIIEQPIPVFRHPLPPAHRFAPLEVRYHHVEAKITDQVAITEVDQAFYNPNDQRLEGTYIFPLPKNARIDRFSMDIDGKMMEAELLDAQKARAIYEDIVRRMKDPALLEYAGQGMFKLRIFPIEPHSTKKIRLKYTELLVRDSGSIRYLYPLNTEKFSAAPLKEVSVKVTLETKEALQAVYSPTHSLDVVRHGHTRATAGYEARDVKPDTDFQLFFSTRDNSDLGLSVLTYNDGSSTDGGFFLLLASPRAKDTETEVEKKDVIFVLDTSGSMADENKLDQAKRALTVCLKNLNSGDRFNVIRFSTEAESLSGSLLEVSGLNLEKAESFVNSMKPLGGTAIEEALLRAVEMGQGESSPSRPLMIVFLTDGMPTVGSTDENEILNKISRKMTDRPYRVFSFGVGHDVNTNLLDRLAEKTRAASQYVLPKEDLELKVSTFYSKISQPVLSGVKIQVSGAVSFSRIQPQEIPDLFKGGQMAVLGRYKGTGPAAVTIEGTINGRAQRFTEEFSFPERSMDNAFIPQLWTSRRVGYLLDQIRLNGENREVREEVTELARKYGIVTPYTAYLIVEDETQRGVPMARQTMQELGGSTVQLEAGAMYRQAQKDKSGAFAVGNAKAFSELSRADSLAAPSVASRFALEGRLETKGAPAAEFKRVMERQASRFVGGRSFYQNGSTWTDSLIQSQHGRKRVEVKFNSDEYFALLARDSKIALWLSLGRNVQFLLDDTICEIVD